eukprot:m.303621 g.303621  ORF g.303621 m.303621 type:complete len:361 (-) comp20169_c0_seq6:110-1192(-)
MPSAYDMHDCGDTVTFYAIGDWGEVSDTLHRVAATMGMRAKNQTMPSFILSLGDNFYPDGVTSVEDSKWKEYWEDVFLRDYPELRVPWKAVLGNNDYRDNPQAQVDFTHSKLNPYDAWHMPDRNYRFSVHSGSSTRAAKAEPTPHSESESDIDDTLIDLFALDTCGVDEGVNCICPHTKEELHTNIASLSAQLTTASPNAWKIVFGHHPLYTAGRAHEASRLREQVVINTETVGIITKHPGYNLERTLHEGFVDLYMAGHDHVFQHHRTTRGDVECMDTVVCGASGALYVGLFHDQLESNSQRGQPRWVEPTQQEFGFVEVTVTPSKLELNFIGCSDDLLKCDEGTIIKTITRERPNPAT